MQGAETRIGRSYDVADKVSLLDVKQYPMLAILTNAGRDVVRKTGKPMKKFVTKDPEFKWIEDTYAQRSFTASSTLDPDGGNLTLAAGGSSLVAGDLLYIVAQNWVVPVVSVTNDTTVVCGAELGGATGGAESVVGEVFKIGNRNAEGATLRGIYRTTPSTLYNYTQIFRTPAGISRTAKNTEGFVKKNDMVYQTEKAAIEHMLDMEYAAIFGKREKVAASGATLEIRSTAGVLSRIATYKTANVDTEAELNTWYATQLFAHGNKEKYLFCSGNAIDLVTTFARNKVQIVQNEKTYGILINKIQTPYGVVNVIHHELLTGTVHGNYAIGLDLECLSYRFMKDSDTKLLTNRQANDEDGEKVEYLSEVGFQIEQESRHAIMSVGAL